MSDRPADFKTFNLREPFKVVHEAHGTPDRTVASSHSESRKGTFKKVIGGTVMAGLLGAGAYIVNNRIQDGAEAHFAKTEQEALSKEPRAWNKVVVLYEGANYRSAPIFGDSDGREPGADTIAGTVKQGEVMRIDRPLRYTDETGKTWIGFTTGDKGANENDSAPERVFWADFRELENQNRNGHPLIAVYDNPDIGSKPNESVLTVSVDSRGNFVANTEVGQRNIATSSNIPVNIFQNQMVPNERLELNHGK